MPSYASSSELILVDRLDRTLPVVMRDTGYLRTRERHARPVWPVPNNEVLTALRGVSELHEAELEWIEHADIEELAQPAENAGCGVVAAIGDDLVEEATLYAHLTGRGVSCFSRWHDIELADVRIEVVVALWSQLTVAAYELIHRYGRENTPIGLVVGSSKVDLRRELLVRSAHRTLPASFGFDGYVLDGTQPLEPDWHSQLGLQLTAPGRVGGPRRQGIVIAVGHSDGVDAQWGSHQILCSRAAENRVPVGSRIPSCVATGFCHRAKTSVSDALGSSMIVNPADVSASVLLFLGCFLAPASESLVAPEWSLLARVLQRGNVGTVVTTWGIAIARQSHAFVIANLLRRGATVSNAVAGFHALCAGDSFLLRPLIFGDPASRPFHDTVDGALERTPDAPHSIELEQSHDDHLDRSTSVHQDIASTTESLSDGRLLVLERIINALPDQPGADGLRATLAAIDREQATSSAADLMFVHYATERSSTIAGSLSTGDNCVEVPCQETCSNCDLPLRSWQVWWSIEREMKRIIFLCDRCGVVRECEEAGALATLTIVRDGVVPRDLALSCARGVVMKTPEGRRTTWVLPAGAPMPTVHADGPGIFDIMVLALRDAEICVVRRKVRADELSSTCPLPTVER